jgi:hypothetical protein
MTGIPQICRSKKGTLDIDGTCRRPLSPCVSCFKAAAGRLPAFSPQNWEMEGHLHVQVKFPPEITMWPCADLAIQLQFLRKAARRAGGMLYLTHRLAMKLSRNL